ncbi:2-oxoglutarate ferredoxin oxidoreductase subunit delta [Desulfohalotomaculum tongense]|uniref:ATP-binding protein n=1 Tax=Desulforadius tongensis TaxID=1216062 RepID=UPI00308432CF|nr:2-oxoglutarate ferredoxin oxidoreductase subunit delta [Desulforadius tongensis]
MQTEVVPKIKETVVKVNEAWCKKCGICAAFCRKGVLVQNKDKKIYVQNPENCVGCGFCVNLCPDYAITLEVVEQ